MAFSGTAAVPSAATAVPVASDGAEMGHLVLAAQAAANEEQGAPWQAQPSGIGARRGSLSLRELLGESTVDDERVSLTERPELLPMRFS